MAAGGPSAQARASGVDEGWEGSLPPVCSHARRGETEAQLDAAAAAAAAVAGGSAPPPAYPRLAAVTTEGTLSADSLERYNYDYYYYYHYYWYYYYYYLSVQQSSPPPARLLQ